MRIDALASREQYAHHLDPLWAALPYDVRGSRIEPGSKAGAGGDAVVVAAASDLGTAWRLGYWRIAYLEHGIGQSYSNRSPGYPGGTGRDKVGLFLSPNETAAARERAAYPGARVEVIGDPRLDTLPHLEAGPGTVAISFHWACGLEQETRPAFAHYRSVIPALAAAVPLIAHAHPRAAETMRPFYERLGIEFVPTFDEVCRRASVYVCDNSSTLYEFASTGRPVVVLNAPWYRRQIRHGLRFWDAATVGVNVSMPDDLVTGVEWAMSPAVDRFQRKPREKALDIVYAYRTGAAVRGAAAIGDWLGSRVEAIA
jgi:hypothetical protein